MSNLTVALAALGGVVLAGVVAHGAWQARKAGPTRTMQPAPETGQYNASESSQRDGEIAHRGAPVQAASCASFIASSISTATTRDTPGSCIVMPIS